MRLATLNVAGSQTFFDALIDKVDDTKTDIIMLQECRLNMATMVRLKKWAKRKGFTLIHGEYDARSSKTTTAMMINLEIPHRQVLFT